MFDDKFKKRVENVDVAVGEGYMLMQLVVSVQNATALVPDKFINDYIVAHQERIPGIKDDKERAAAEFVVASLINFRDFKRRVLENTQEGKGKGLFDDDDRELGKKLGLMVMNGVNIEQ